MTRLRPTSLFKFKPALNPPSTLIQRIRNISSVWTKRSVPFVLVLAMLTGDNADPSVSDDVSSTVSSAESLDEIVINSGPRKINIFTLYAKIFRLLLTAQIPNFSLLSDELRNRELDKLILPSDEDWRHRVYHSLVELQRERDAEIVEDRR